MLKCTVFKKWAWASMFVLANTVNLYFLISFPQDFPKSPSKFLIGVNAPPQVFRHYTNLEDDNSKMNNYVA